MSGLQEIAAIVGIGESAFRSISALYNFLRSLHHAPADIANLQVQIAILEEILTALSAIEGLDGRTEELFEQIGLPQALYSCGQACNRLHNDLNKWTKSGKETWTTKIQFRWHRKSVDTTLAEIRSAKETTLLAVVVTQL